MTTQQNNLCSSCISSIAANIKLWDLLHFIYSCILIHSNAPWDRRKHKNILLSNFTCIYIDQPVLCIQTQGFMPPSIIPPDFKNFPDLFMFEHLKSDGEGPSLLLFPVSDSLYVIPNSYLNLNEPDHHGVRSGLWSNKRMIQSLPWDCNLSLNVDSSFWTKTVRI